MSYLSRYQRPKGFQQLINLLESCSSEKRDRIMKLIEDESPAWAATLSAKILTFEKILAWEEEIRRELFGRIKPLTLAILLHGINDQEKATLMSTLSHSEMRRISELSDIQKPTRGVISTAVSNFVIEVRRLIEHGYVRIEQIDPSLVIGREIELEIAKAELNCKKVS